MTGNAVKWFVEPGQAVWIESKYLRPISGNLFDADKLGAVANEVIRRRKNRSFVSFYASYGQIHRITPENIAESLAYKDYDSGTPWTTGLPALDDWLLRRENKETTAEEDREMEPVLDDAVATGSGDLGKWTATVRDGNHRTFGAVLGREEKVAVRFYDNDVQDMREAARRRASGAAPNWNDDQMLELLEQGISDTAAYPDWLDPEEAKEISIKLLATWDPSIEESRGKVYVTVKGLGRILEVLDHGNGALKPIQRGLDEDLFPDDGGNAFRRLHTEALKRR